MFRKVSVNFLCMVMCKIVFFIPTLGHTGFLSCRCVWPKVEVFVSKIFIKSVYWHKGNAYGTCKKVMNKNKNLQLIKSTPHTLEQPYMPLNFLHYMFVQISWFPFEISVPVE